MPKIQWSGLPDALRTHLLQRLKVRSVTEQDLVKLMEWRQTEPDAPDGLWYKDFGSFKVCGEGQYPKTFLLRGQPAKGQPRKTATAARTHATSGVAHALKQLPQDGAVAARQAQLMLEEKTAGLHSPPRSRARDLRPRGP